MYPFGVEEMDCLVSPIIGINTTHNPMMTTMIDEPVFELRQRLIHWSYAVKLADITDRLQDLLDSDETPAHKQPLAAILEQLRALQCN